MKRRRTSAILLFCILWCAVVALAVVPWVYNSFDPLQELLLVAGALPVGAACLARVYADRLGSNKGISAWLFVPLIFVLLSLTQVVAGKPTQSGISGLGWWAALSVAAILPVLLEGGERVLLLRSWIVIGVVQALVVVLQAAGFDPLFLLVGRFEGIWRVYGSLGNPNLAAALLVPVTLLGLDRRLVPAAALRIGILFLLGLAVVLTGSRAAALVLAGGLVLSMVQQNKAFPRYGRKVIWITAAGMVALSFGVAAMMGKGFTSPAGRLFFWETAMRLIMEKPLAGHGWGGFQVAYLHGLDLLNSTRVIPETLPVHPDNDWLEFGVELGVYALLALAFVLLLMRKVWWNGDARPLVIALGSLMVLSFFYSPLHTPATALLFWSLFGMLAAFCPRNFRKRGLFFLLLTVSVVCLAMTLPSSWSRLQGHVTAVRAEQLEANQDDRAAETWQQAWHQAPAEGEFAFRAAYLLTRRGEYREALALVDRSTQTWSSFNALVLRAWLLAAQGRIEEALAQLDWLADKFPGLSGARELREALHERHI